MTSVVVSCFPLSGKTYAYQHSAELDLSCIDIDTVCESDDPSIYVDCIAKYLGQVRYILVSYRPEIRLELSKRHINFVAVAPTYGDDVKVAWFSRATSLTNNFYTLMNELEEHYEEWLQSAYERIGNPLYTLHTSDYLSDILETIE